MGKVVWDWQNMKDRVVVGPPVEKYPTIELIPVSRMPMPTVRKKLCILLGGLALSVILYYLMKPTDNNFDGRAIFSGHYSVSTSKKGPDTTRIDSMKLFCAIGPFGVAGGCPTMEKVPIGSVVTAEFVHYNALIGSGYVLVSLKNDANDRVFNQSVEKILDSWNKYAIFWACMYLAAAAYGLFLS